MTAKKTNYEVIIASPPEYEELVAEIYHNGLFVALLSKEAGNECIELEIADALINQSMVCRKVDLNGFLQAVEIARNRLIG